MWILRPCLGKKDSTSERKDEKTCFRNKHASLCGPGNAWGVSRRGAKCGDWRGPGATIFCGSEGAIGARQWRALESAAVRAAAFRGLRYTLRGRQSNGRGR